MIPKIKVGFFAEDSSPVKQARCLIAGFPKSQFKICSFLGADTFATPINGYGRYVDIVDLAFVWVNGTSQVNVVALIDKLESKGTPVWIVEDTPGASLRIPKSSIQKTVGVVSSIQATGHFNQLQEAYKRGEYLGVPGHWQAEFENVTEKPDPLPDAYDPERKLVVIAGEADPEYNNDVLEEIMYEIAQSKNVDSIDVFFGAHPKDGQTITEEQCRRRQRVFVGHNIIEAPGFSAPKMMSLADIVIVFGAGTNIAERARSNRPLIYFSNHRVREFLRDKMGCPSGRWWVEEYNGAVSASTHCLANLIDELLRPDSAVVSLLSSSQEENFPIPKDWNEQSENFCEFVKRELMTKVV